jgi:hypothetical protein
MKKTTKFLIFVLLIFSSLLIFTNYSKAAETENATDESTLRSAIENVNDGGTVEIQNNITVTGPIVIQKKLTIDGNGYTVSGSTEWTSTSGNQTMFTAQMAAGQLTLKDINLNNGPKYGVQSYDGATVILNNVSITGFKYGGVLANGGNVEVIDLHLGYNGTNANNGIEIDKGASATNNPTLTMNGTLTSDSNENVVRVADNGYLTEFTVTNTENTENKVVIAGEKIVLTDENNNVISETSVPDTVTSNTDTEAVVITLIHGEKSEKIVTEKGNTITEEFLKAYITVEEGYEIDGFFTDDKFTNKFDFSKTVDTDTSIYVKTSKIESEEEKDEVKDEKPEEEKDDIPKTGEENYLGIAVLSILFSSIMAIGLTKKNSI